MIRRIWGLSLALLLTGAVQADKWTMAGDVLSVALPLTALTATYSLDDPQGRRALVTSYSLALVGSQVLRAGIERERPDGSDRYSFPSPHTVSAFSGASFLQRRYGWEVGLPAYLTASYVGWSRVEDDQHHVSDVLAGAALAWGVNRWLVPAGRPGLALVPTTGGAALAFNLNF